MLPAPPAVPVAVNVTGLPVSPLAVAVSVLVPAVAPSVQLPTLAMPLALVVWLAPVMLPLPGATANVTVTPPTGLPPPSFTITDGWIGTVPPTGAVCLSPPLIAICVAGPAVTVTVVDVTVPSWGAVKLRVRAPAMPVMVRLVNVAVPELLVAIGFAPLNAGPPLASAAVTATPLRCTAFPAASCSCRTGRCGRDLEWRARLAQGAGARPQRVALPHALDREVRERGHAVHRGERGGAA